ncbi:MAG TPA: HAMP domain-containing sensor histidine kinase [Blastocatellia bacterium]|nr:HAMP domain-containing sensor histidine kinase [Blastocatellia bacterium]
MFNSVRARLTLWYVFVFGSLLIGFSIIMYALLSRSLRERFDQSLSNATQATAAEFLNEANEFEGNAEAGAAETLQELRLPNTYTVIFTPNKLLASNFPKGEPFILSQELLSALRDDGQVSFHTIAGFGKDGARMAVVHMKTFDQDFYSGVAEPLHSLDEQMETIRRIFYVGLPATLLVAGISGFLLAKKSFSPVIEMSEQAKRIGATNLEERLTVSNSRDELGRLAETFNELLSRLDRSFENMREFMADASHELRTPLSIIRGEADVALSQNRNATEYKETLAIIQDEARRLSFIVDDMLALARADAGQHPLKFEEFYLNDLVEDACRAAQVLAVRKGVALRLDLNEDIAFCGDEVLLRRLIMNLLDNAIKYTPAGGSVSVRLVSEPEQVKFIVSDTGIGIPAESAPYIFERFYRADKARSRADGGSGLGLAIARWVAEAHKGSIDLVSNPDHGSKFTVSLPR